MYTIQKHFQYNAWANTKIAEILTKLSEEELDKEIVSSFPSLKKTVLHIWDAETIWLTRLEGGTLAGWPSASFKGGKDELLKGFLATSERFADLVSSKDSGFFQTSIAYKNMKGIEFTNAIDDVLHHVVNHGSFHRGQIITMLRQLGHTDFPAQDLIAFARLQA